MNDQNTDLDSLSPTQLKQIILKMRKGNNLKSSDHLQVETLKKTNGDAQAASNIIEDEAPRKNNEKSQEKILNSPLKNSPSLNNQLESQQKGNLRDSSVGVEIKSEEALAVESESEEVVEVQTVKAQVKAEPEENEEEEEEDEEEEDEDEDEEEEKGNERMKNRTQNTIEDFSQILKNAKFSDSEEEKGSQHPQSHFVLNLMRRLYSLSLDKERFLCCKCLDNEIARKGKARQNRHWYPVRSLLRHLLKAHVFEFKKHEKEFLKHIGFFQIIEKSCNYEKIVNQFKFSYQKLKDLSSVYCSVKEHNIRKKKKILRKMQLQLKSILLVDKHPKDSDAIPIKESSNLSNKLTQPEAKKDIKRENKSPVSFGKNEKENFELNNRGSSDVQDDTVDKKSANNLRSNKRTGADISGEDEVVKKAKKDVEFLQNFYNLSCDLFDLQRKHQEEVTKLKEESQKQREKIEKYEQILRNTTK